MDICKKLRIPILHLFDLCSIAVCALLFLHVSIRPAYAYVDPSVMTYTIQAVAGVAVALSAVLGVAYRRVRRKLMRLLNIDENAGKLVEPDVSRIAGTQQDAIDEQAALEKCQLYSKPLPPTFSWKKRLIISMIISASLVATVCFVSPCELVSANEGELIFELDLIWPVMAFFSIIAFAIMSLVLTLIRGRAFLLVSGLLAAVSLGFLVQILFLNTGLPVADGSEFQLSNHKTITLLDTVVWITLIVLAVYFIIRKPLAAMRGAVAACCFVFVVQGIYGATIFKSQPEKANEETEYTFISDEGIFDLAPKNNVVVFVMDTIDNRVFAEMIKDYPSYFDDLTGFTAYTDVAGSMIPTRYALPYLLTGVYPQVDESLDEYIADRYDRSSFIEDVKNRGGYSVGIYSDASLGPKDNIKSISDDVINVHVIGGASANEEMDKLGTFCALCKSALLRDVPWLMKPLFWFDTNSLNNAMVKTEAAAETSASHGAYTIDDVRFYDSLSESVINITDYEHEGAFRLYHLNGMHAPIEVDENAHHVDLDVSDAVEQSGLGGQNIINQGLGNFAIVDEYLRQLRNLDLYDDTTIIITSDHGISMYGDTERWYTMPPSIESPATPIFLLKRAETAEEAAKPLTFSDTPIGHSDFIPTILSAIGVDYAGYEGSPVSEIQDGERIRYSYMTLSDGSGKRAIAIRRYAIRGDVSDLGNWEFTGEEWAVDES